MIAKILSIRIKQTYRNIASIGIFRIIILLIITILLLAFIFKQLQQTRSAVITIIFIIATIFFIHIRRKDKTFINIITDKPQLIYLSEYLILLLPFLVQLIILKNYILTGYLILGTAIIPFINISIKKRKENINNKILKIIPNDCFEIKSGLRQNFYFIIPLNIIAVALGFWIGTAPIVLIINTLIFSTFYILCEPRNIIEINELAPNIFISKKLKSNLIIFIFIQLPIILMFLIFNYQHYMIVTIIFAISLLFIVFAILLKYAMYYPNAELQANTIILTITFFFLPIIFVMIPIYYYKAKKNLILYLNDYN